MKTESSPVSVTRFAAIIALLLPLTGCLVAGYSSGSGFWIWPGSIGLTLILLALMLLLNRRH